MCPSRVSSADVSHAPACGDTPWGMRVATLAAPVAIVALALGGVGGAAGLAWAPELGLDLAWRVDALSSVLLLLVGVVSLGVFAWFWSLPQQRPRHQAGLLLAFLAAMVGLLTADNAITLFVFWELTTLASYGLIGFDGTDPKARRAARTSLLVTGLGGLALLAGTVLLGVVDVSLADLGEVGVATPAAVVGAYLLLVAAATKSAQVPFHGWLTGAMTAPTAASALLHAATLVIAGVYLVLRTAPLAGDVPGWTATAVTVGLATYVWGHWGARSEADAKAVLAGTTAAQMGLGIALAALATSKATVAALAVLFVHGIYKAGLFLLVGTVKERNGTREVGALGSAVRGSRGLTVALWGGAAALAGVPPLAGWVAKEAGVAAALAAASPVAVVALGIGTALGVAVGGRLVLPTRPAPHERRRVGGMAVAVPVLAAVAVAGLGPWIDLVGPRLREAAVVVAGEGALDVALVVWPGMSAPLVVSLLALGGGLLLVGYDRAALRTGQPVGGRSRASAHDVLAAGIDGVATGSRWAATQVARLDRPGIIGVALAAALALLWPWAVRASTWPTNLPFAHHPLQAVAVVVLAAATLGVVRSRHRFHGAVLLGLVGFSMGGLFAIQGAPDLVLTQVVVETVMVVAFAGILRRLPERADLQPRPLFEPGQTWRWLLAVTGGLLAADLTLSTGASTADRPVAALLAERAVPDGGGTNIVNVVLTDFRALDTVGELIVLFLAAAGALGLARSRRTSPIPSAAASSRSGGQVPRRQVHAERGRRDIDVTDGRSLTPVPRNGRARDLSQSIVDPDAVDLQRGHRGEAGGP